MKKTIFALSLLLSHSIIFASCDMEEADNSKIFGQLKNVMEDSKRAVDCMIVEISVLLKKRVSFELLSEQIKEVEITDQEFIGLKYSGSQFRSFAVKMPLCSIVKLSNMDLVRGIEFNGVFHGDPSVRVGQ